MAGRFCLFVLCLSACATASAHPNSVSYSHLAIDDGAIHAIVRLPLDDVDLLMRLDRDLDGRVSDAELEASRLAIAGYFDTHLRLAVDGAPLRATLGRLSIWRDAAAFQYLEGDVSFAGVAAGQLSVRSDFLTELFPSHRTLGRIVVSGRDERFTFTGASTYTARIGSNRPLVLGTAVLGVAVLCALVVVRRRTAAVAVAMLLVAPTARADVIMSAPALNATLKTMEKLKRQVDGEVAAGRAEALFQLGAEADALAGTMNLEVESHGMQERALLDLALSRTKELGVGIAYNGAKKKFFYDGAAFADYLKQAPRGAHAAAAEFKLLSYAFYQASADDVGTIATAASAKKQFLARYPRFEANAEMRLYLAVDFRDLYQRYADARDAPNAAKYRRLARAECLRITRTFSGTEQADAARQLLRTLDRSQQ